jgi:hypothetical protein
MDSGDYFKKDFACAQTSGMAAIEDTIIHLRGQPPEGWLAAPETAPGRPVRAESQFQPARTLECLAPCPGGLSTVGPVTERLTGGGIEALNISRYDAMTIGNYFLDFGHAISYKNWRTIQMRARIGRSLSVNMSPKGTTA